MVEKNPALSFATEKGDPKEATFEHRGETVVVLYHPPSVEDVQLARRKAMSASSRGRKVNFQLDTFLLELTLLEKCLVDSNIPGIPEGGTASLRAIKDYQLWEKLLKECQIKDADSMVEEDELVEAAEEVVDELGGKGYVSVDRLAQVLETDQEEEDIKKS